MEKILKKLKKLLRLIFGRTTLGTLFLLIQILVLFAGFDWFREYLIYMYGGSAMLSALVLIYIISDEVNSTIKLSLVVPILIFPLLGTLFYLFLTLQPGTRRINRRIEEGGTKLRPYLLQDPEVLAHYESISASGGNLVRYMNQYGRFPAYENTGVCYFPLGDDMFPVLLEELKKAEHFIFMEYFIVEHGVMWDAILQVLETKAAEGVEVRFMYDGTCSISLLPYNYPKKLEEYGIRCKIFNPIKPALSTVQNNRDHRKIVVIDGKTAFTGGVNLADEYINEKMKFGYWKDAGIRLTGDCVWNFTSMFLEMWDYITKSEDDYAFYRNASIPQLGNATRNQWIATEGNTEVDGENPAATKRMAQRRVEEPHLTGAGFVQPYCDSPLDHEDVGENVYLNLIEHAKRYVYIFTPYLIFGSEMATALINAAKCGVDVRIVVPGVPDKKLVYLLTQGNFAHLIKGGVKIYKYTPGFIHSKCFVVDDVYAAVGTINLDYRSLYLHFECGTFMYRTKAVMQVKEDALATIDQSLLVTLAECQSKKLIVRMFMGALKLFAPLL